LKAIVPRPPALTVESVAVVSSPLASAPGTPIAAGTITVTDPQSSTVLPSIPIVLPSATEPFEIVHWRTPTPWRDFVVTGLLTSTKAAALQIWYRTQPKVTKSLSVPQSKKMIPFPKQADADKAQET
jgi:hypothetical protein